MKVEKQIIDHIEKCYAITFMQWQGDKHFLVGAEKQGPCRLYTLDGSRAATINSGPGGVMTMVPWLGAYGGFLSTQKFYSPNDSTEAELVYIRPDGTGGWVQNSLIPLPFVHRFDVLEWDGRRHLIACTIKSGHAHKDDWSTPGKIYVAELPDDLTVFSAENPLELTALKDGLFHNHGYCRLAGPTGSPSALVGSDQGLFRVFPPGNSGEMWRVELVLEEAVSDAVELDLDGDGERELFIIRRFHGEEVAILKKGQDGCTDIYSWREEGAFVHAIWGGELMGRPAVVFGCRGGNKALLALTRGADGAYRLDTLDEGVGSANVAHFVHDGKDVIVSANRELDEVALYTLS